MSFLDVLNEVNLANPDNFAYTRPWQLPVNVKFEIMKGGRVKKNNSEDFANRVAVRAGSGLNLLVYISGKFGKLTKEDFDKMNNDIKNDLKFYLVSRGGVSLETVVLELLPRDNCSNLPLFDESLHLIKKCDSTGKPIKCLNCDESNCSPTPSPLKKFKSN